MEFKSLLYQQGYGQMAKRAVCLCNTYLLQLTETSFLPSQSGCVQGPENTGCQTSSEGFEYHALIYPPRLYRPCSSTLCVHQQTSEDLHSEAAGSSLPKSF